MKQTLTDLFSVDEFGCDESRAPRVYEMPPKDHFLETEDDQKRDALYDRVLPRLTSSLERRIAAVMILDQDAVTIPHFRDLNIDRKTLTEAKRRVRKVMQTV